MAGYEDTSFAGGERASLPLLHAFLNMSPSEVYVVRSLCYEEFATRRNWLFASIYLAQWGLRSPATWPCWSSKQGPYVSEERHSML